MNSPTDTMTVDPYDDDFQQDPFPSYRRLRAESPIYQVPGEPWFMVTTMDLIRQVLRDPATYSNAVSTARRSEPPAEVAEEVAAIRAQGYLYRPALGLNDPPEHGRYRRLVNRAFTPRALAWMDPLVEQTARELAGALPDGEVVDIIDTVTRPLPIFAILRILGLPEERRADIARWSEAATASLGAKLTSERWLEVERDMLDFQQVISGELDERRARPREDLLSAIVRSEPDEEPLGNAELVWLVRELLVAGNETTTRALAEIVQRLDDRPDPWREIRADPSVVSGMVEEGVRMSAPAIGMFRQVTRDTALGGVNLLAGTTLYLVYGSANRDEQVFSRPDAYDPNRPNVREHISFGHGIHACVGAGLARIEAAATLRALADNVDGLHVVPDAELRYIASFFIRGLMQLPVRVERRHVGR